jgi:hypothetical protein
MILLKLAEGTRLLFYDETSQPKSEFTQSLNSTPTYYLALL